jgi:site-specific DNA recombinase
MVEIGRREKVGKRYVSRVMRLAFLAPEIVEQIVNGCQPPELTAQSLLNDRTELPLAWKAQHKVLGFARRRSGIRECRTRNPWPLRRR